MPYADPLHCPDCHAPLPHSTRCHVCGLLLSVPLARELLATLTRADALLDRLRAESRATAPTPVAVPAAPAAAAPPGVPAAAAPAPAESPGAASSGTSVPRILLGLGAVCLLVAALVFLAVTWSRLGVGGRTAVLAATTLVTGALAGVVARRGLRGATEALGTVTTGLLVLDLVGAQNAGWFGGLPDTAFSVLLGGVLAASGLAAAGAASRTSAGGLTCGELATALGALVASAGLAAGAWASLPARVLVALLATAALAAGAGRLSRALPRHRAEPRTYVVATAGLGAVVVLDWLWLLLTGVERVAADPDVATSWTGLGSWPVLAAAAIAAAVASWRPVAQPLRTALAGVALLLVAVVLAAPASDERRSVLAAAVVAVVTGAVVLLHTAPRRWAAAGLAPSLPGLVVLGALALRPAYEAVARYGDLATDGWQEPGGRLGPVVPGTGPWWLLPALALAAVAVAAALPRLLDRPVRPTPMALAAALAVVTAAGAAALLLRPVPVWLPVVLLLAAGLVAAGSATAARTSRTSYAVLAAGLLLSAQPPSWHDAALTLVAATTSFAAAVALLVRGTVTVRLLAGAAAPPALALAGWAAGHLVGVAGEVRALAVLLLVAGVAVGWSCVGRRSGDVVGVELGALVAGVLVGMAGSDAAPLGAEASWTAAYLTLAGVAVALLAVLRPDRRQAGWLAALLLASASWVRLTDLGVGTPEAYTLPSALALLAVGLHRLRRDPAAGTHRTLGAGLGLALVPSLLWVLDEPASVRAVVLGAACLGLVLAGARLQWRAPLVAGAAVGLALVLREAAPHLGSSVPRWALIGAAGAALVALGTTWEQRLRDGRAVAGYLRQLR